MNAAIVLLVLLIGAGVTFCLSWLLSWAWGVALVPMGVPAISTLQAWCLMLVIGLLTGGLRVSATK